jgi:transcription elongation factor Elf1
MMKVISKPDYTTWKYEFTCYTCTSKLSADYTDLKYKTTKQWYGGRDVDDGFEADVDNYYFICPICGHEKSFRFPNEKGLEIPYLLQEKVKKDYNESNKKVRH